MKHACTARKTSGRSATSARSVDIAPVRGRTGAVGGASGEALIYVDRNTREAFLQGWCE